MLKRFPASLECRSTDPLLRPSPPPLLHRLRPERGGRRGAPDRRRGALPPEDGTVRSGGASSYLADRLPEDGRGPGVRRAQRQLPPARRSRHTPSSWWARAPALPVPRLPAGAGSTGGQRARTGSSSATPLHPGLPLSGGVAALRQIRACCPKSLAFSRDQANKIYVQDRLREAGGPSSISGWSRALTSMSAATPTTWRRMCRKPC